MQTPSLDESVHVIGGDSAAGSLRHVGGRNIVVLHDPRSPGPCDVNPTRHRQKREAFLRGYFEPIRRRDRGLYAAYQKVLSRDILHARDLADRLADSPEKPVRLWTAPSWHDRLALWWVLDALKRTRLRVERFWIAEPALEEGVKLERMAGFSMGAYSPRCFRDEAASLRPLDRGLLEAGSSLWRAFAGRSPVRFDLACRETRRFPDLPWTAQPYSTLFPRVVGRRLTLSEVDQAILDALCTRGWRNLVAMLRSNRHLLKVFSYFGDLFFIRRASEWARTPAVLMRDTGGDSAHTAIGFRITGLGERLRKQGMHSASEAPAIWVGGCRLYGKGPVWVRRKHGKRWRFEHIEP